MYEPFHAFEHIIATGLHGHMQVGTNLRHVRTASSKSSRHVMRKVGNEFDTFDPRRVVDNAPADRSSVYTDHRRIGIVTVDGLAKQRDLLTTFGGKLRTSAAMCSGGRLCSGPRTLGTMQ